MHALVDRNKTGLAEPILLLSGLNAPNGVAWHNNSLYVGEMRGAWLRLLADAALC